jgi:hypothetical protein
MSGRNFIYLLKGCSTNYSILSQAHVRRTVVMQQDKCVFYVKKPIRDGWAASVSVQPQPGYICLAHKSAWIDKSFGS